MKRFDHARFQNAFERPPEAFHNALKKSVNHITPRPKPVFSRRAALIFAMLAVCLVGTAAAVMVGTTLNDFLNVDMQSLHIPITNEFAVDGKMDLLNVKVREAASDGVFMYMAVEFSLKDQDGKAMIYGSDVHYLQNPDNPLQSNDVQLALEAVQNSQTVYWFKPNAITFRDREGVLRRAMYEDCRYESAQTMVVLYWLDLRTDDAFEFGSLSAGYPDTLTVSMSPALYIYEKTEKIAVLEKLLSDISNPGDYLTCAEAGKFTISAAPQRQSAQKYRIATFPERFYELRVVSATVTETPLAYYLRLDFQKTEDCAYPDYSMYPEVFDKDGQPLPFFFLTRSARFDTNEPVENRLEAIYIKQDDRKPHTLRVSPHWDEEKNLPVTVQMDLVPVD